MIDPNESKPIQAFTVNEGILKNKSTNINKFNIRSGPSLNRRVIHEGKEGDKVTIIDQTKPAGDTRVWYKVKIRSLGDDIGWVRQDMIELIDSNSSPALTLLLFTTKTSTVKIYSEEEQIYLNIYNNRSKKTQLYPVEAAKLPQLDPENKCKSYVAIKDNSAYYISFIPFGEVDFIVINANNGNIIIQEKGFSASGSEYQINDQ